MSRVQKDLDQYKTLLGLIGFPLSHSFSQSYFQKKFEEDQILDHWYENFPIPEINHLPDLFSKHKNLIGINVTIPYKEQVIPYLDQLDETAHAIQAVNTIKRVDGKLFGFNTDVYGFRQSIIPLLKPHHQRALILGTGGASKAVKYVLNSLGIEYLSISRNPIEDQIGYPDLNQTMIEFHSVIINTTPLGMVPKIDQFPDIPYQYISRHHLLYDLIYNPAETAFLKFGKSRGAQIKNGHEMLILQAERAWAIWH